jgi:hypothetical protein
MCSVDCRQGWRPRKRSSSQRVEAAPIAQRPDRSAKFAAERCAKLESRTYAVNTMNTMTKVAAMAALQGVTGPASLNQSLAKNMLVIN